MELIIISKTKLKIMLNECDMRKYSIGSNTDCADPSTRKAIRKLLECAKEQIGFNTEGDEIFVQLYTSKNGGCELFVTKSEEETNNSEDADDERRREAAERILADISRSKKSSLPEKRGSSSLILHDNEDARKERSKALAYSFSSLNDLCRVCRILKGSAIAITGSAYSDAHGRFYLIISGASLKQFSKLDKFSFIHEFGKRENFEYLSIYINENAKTICSENAIQVLGEF